VFGLRCAVAVAAMALLLDALARPQPLPPPVSLATMLEAARRRRLPAAPWRATAWGLVGGITLFGAAATTLCLVFDPRYRDFAAALYAVPAIALLAVTRLAQCRNGVGRSAAGTPGLPLPGEADDRREERLLALVLAAGGVAVAIGEGLANHQALSWSVVCLLLAAGAWLLPKPAPDQVDRRRSATAPSKAPAAAGSGR
jgi:hypothetical protein